MGSLPVCVALIGTWVVIGLLGLARARSVRFAGRVLFVAGALVSAALAITAASGLGQAAQTLVLPIGLPDLPFHLRLDALSRVFLLLLGASATAVSVFAAGYFRRGEGALPGLLCLQYHVFLASMAVVLLADDAYAFMVAWETMALSSYFLVTTQHRLAEIRRAGFLYLIIAHVGALAILLAFGVMQGGSWQFTFEAMRHAALTPGWSSLAFLLALVGFGAKAGLVPLHVWLPEAHPAAPSPVSALMSGVMLKTAVYGLLRVSFDLLATPQWWWGMVAIGVGLASAFYGVIFAAVQTDMKRLLAWSSIENIGLIVTAIGLALVFRSLALPAFATLALLAALYHCLNHAQMKTLLFLGTGAVLHATGERNLGHLGGLIHRMPWVAWLTLVGVLAIAGLPPLNGFVSEWLLLQSFLYADLVPRSFANMLLPIGAALVALAAALAAYVMVKFYGVIFLGQPREPALAQAREASWLERAGLLLLAAGCIVLGALPVQVLRLLDPVCIDLLGTGAGQRLDSWWLMAPNATPATYGPLVLLLVGLAWVAAAVIVVGWLYHRRVRRVPAWDCGFVRLDARMQDSAEGFGQPIRHIFQPFFVMRRELPTPFDATPTYRVDVTDRIWHACYEPIGPWVRRAADAVAWLQQGRISTYLMYSFLTLVLLLALVLVQ